MKLHLKKISFAFAIAGLMSGVAVAGPAIDFTTVGQSNPTSYYGLGFQFQVDNAVTAIGLGVFDFGQMGFAQRQQVGLWDSSGALIASTYIDHTAPLSNFWRFASINPVELVAGESYIVSSQGGEGYSWGNSGFSVDPNISFMASLYAPLGHTGNNPLVRPTISLAQDLNGAYFGGNVLFAEPSPAPVPEPVGIALIGVGLAGLLAAQRRKTTESKSIL